MDPRTIRALAEMTDEGRFEQMALAILHHAEPLCACLSQQGVNASGKTRASPVDNIGFVRGATPPHLVAIHHTTAIERDLRAKWMTEPSDVRSIRIGDIAKTAKIVAEERDRKPELAATLFLTTNREPDEKLVRDAVSLGAQFGITIDIWSRVRLARVLDLDRIGQSIRRTFLGIEQELLSPDLLSDLSRMSLGALAPPELSVSWIARDVDRQFLQSRRPVSFVIGESGSGKTVACLRAMTHWITAGGFALILSEDIIDTATSLSGAVLTGLRRLHPELADTPGALSLATATQPLLLVIEDINHSANPGRAIEKVARWAGDPVSDERRGVPAWRILCPVWPRFLNGLSEQSRRLVEPLLVQPKPFTEHDGIAALEVKAQMIGYPISTMAAYALSTALAHDPLLIGLHDLGTTSTADTVIADFVERSLLRCENRTGTPASELRVALVEMAKHMLQRRLLSPTWSDVSSWPSLHAQVDALRQLFAHGEIIRLEGSTARQKVGFRHDRVRDHLLVAAAAALHDAAALADDMITDPFLAEIFGSLLLDRLGERALVERVCAGSPLAIFHALKRAHHGTENRSTLTAIAAQWLAAVENRGRDKSALRAEMTVVLMDAEGPDIITLAKSFPDSTPHSRMARLRNGEIEAGVEDCLQRQFYNRAQWRERQIEHAKFTHATTLSDALSARLREPKIDGDVRAALLNLAGSMADPRLLPAISASWESDEARIDRLDDYLWAFAYCCTSENAEAVLRPICAAWGALPQERNGGMPSPRDDLADSGIRWSFERRPPGPAIDYLVKRGEQGDLEWQIYYLLHGVDHPAAVRFSIRAMAKARAKSEQWYYVNFRNGSDHWQRYADEFGIHMSAENRAWLREHWQNGSGDSHERIAAFDLWVSSWGDDDLGHMRAHQDDELLSDRILRRRLERGDADAIPLLLPKLQGEQQRYWWQFTRTVWSDDLTDALRDAFEQRAAQIAQSTDLRSDIDHALFEALIRLPLATAEALLQEYWESVSTSPELVQAALYLATPPLLQRAATAIAASPNPTEIFKFLTMHFGVKQRGHPGLTRPEQIVGLAPYFDFIEEKDLDWLAEGCNAVGWFNLRRRLFDPKIPNSSECWTEARLPGLFDRLAEEKRFASLDIERVLETGLSWPAVAAALKNWIKERPHEDALCLAAEILEDNARRADLDILRAWPGKMTDKGQALIANTESIVRHRTVD
ncbi:MAG: hypothetical protein KKD64_05220 [Alphaproteobacteria bacterium]|nr:hypothetical protein [Alphaproteobacteria bacterium]MBU0792647.1 hypothetical protein [Alphaproteobacteria bacterium]MBU0875772.1 hypothetical protein [Alphaproteobacteria bacterium]MBU1769037.1 hypothetical protein [Alphaproteobacteria bacterium]